MLSISTTPNDASLLNIAGHLLQETPSNVFMAAELTGMVRPENSSWNDCLRVADMLLNNGEIGQAKKLMKTKSIPDCWEKALIVAKISCADQFIIQGRKKEAEALLRDISPDVIMRYRDQVCYRIECIVEAILCATNIIPFQNIPIE